MRVKTIIHNTNGDTIQVFYSATDCDDFNRSWPASAVRGRGSFTFDGQGNLTDCSGTARKGEGDGWVAFSQDCQLWGRTKARLGSTIAEADKAVWNRRRGLPPDTVTLYAYEPTHRPPGYAHCPEGWELLERPQGYGWERRTDLPVSQYLFGVIGYRERLSQDDVERYELRSLGQRTVDKQLLKLPD